MMEFKKYHIALFLYFLMIQANAQYKRAEEKFFPEPDTDELFDTPAFHKKGFTDEVDLNKFLADLKKKYPDLVRLGTIGKTQRGRDIPSVTIQKRNGVPDKVRVAYLGAIHGNELATTEGLLHFLNILLGREENHTFLDSITLVVLPMINIDGYLKERRLLANGLDLNRDQAKLETVEARAIKKFFGRFDPQVVIDFHEYNPYRADFRDMDKVGTSSYYDFMFLYSDNLNQTPAVKSLVQDYFVTNARNAADQEQLRHTKYVTVSDWRGYQFFNSGGTNIRSSASANALLNAVSILMEVRGVGLQKQNFKRRVFTIKTLAMSYLRTSYQNRTVINQKLEESLNYIKTTRDPVVVTATNQGRNTTFKMIDLNTLEPKDYPIILKESSNRKVLIERTRPEGYFVSDQYPEVIEKLKLFGFKMTRLNSSVEMTCERFEVKSTNLDMSGFEDRNTLEVKTRLRKENILFAPGTYYISTRQKRGQLLSELLEPEASNSFLRMRIIDLIDDNEYGVYRAVTPMKITP